MNRIPYYILRSAYSTRKALVPNLGQYERRHTVAAPPSIVVQRGDSQYSEILIHNNNRSGEPRKSTDGLCITSTRAHTHRELTTDPSGGRSEKARVRKHCGPLCSNLVAAGITINYNE